jgi:non-ribosomal peptide synthetase component F
MGTRFPGRGRNQVGRTRSFLGCLDGHASRGPDAVALTAGAERITYAHLAARARAAYARIDALGLPADDLVAIHPAPSPDTIAVVIACLAARRTFLLPATDLGPTATDSLLARARCSDVLTVVADPEHVTGERVHLIDCTPIEDLTDVAEPAGPPDDVAVLFTEAGVNGLPTIVALDFRSIDELTDQSIADRGLGFGTVVRIDAPFDSQACVLDVRATLKAGGTAILA